MPTKRKDKTPTPPKSPRARARTGAAVAAATQFAVVHPNAAGIDIGGQSHWVAVPPERDGPTVRQFSAFTHDLHQMVHWLKSHNVTTVAMESTGVLWIPVFEVLDSAGLEVYLVNAAHVKNVSGRKSDLLDCQWIQKLHACGLLQRSFRPDDKTVVLRSYVRQRSGLVRAQNACTQRMHKALTQMNIQLPLVLQDITGVTGMAILKQILAGQRDPHVLASLRDRRCKRSEAEIAQALCGTWRQEHLFALRQSLETYEHLGHQIQEVDQQIAQALAAMDNDPRMDGGTSLGPPPKKIRVAQKELGFDARTMLYHKAGSDLTRILGINLLTALTIISEIGTDMSRWPTDKHFSSWLGLAPNRRISGGKELSSHTRKTNNRAAQAMRVAVSTLYRSRSPLGDFYRRKLPKGKPQAITATAHRMARWIYAILKNGTEYAEEKLAREQERTRKRQMASLERSAARLGLSLVPKAQAPQEVAMACA